MSFFSFRVLLLLLGACVVIMLMLQPKLSWTSIKDAHLFWRRSAIFSLSSGNGSICSERSSARGPGQKVVSYSFYGSYSNFQRYFLGLEANAKDVPNFYPDWVVRVYHDIQEDDPIWEKLLHLQDFYSHLDFCSVDTLMIGNFSGGQQRAWRFLPLSDPLVEVMVSRDLDSRFSRREVEAVREWLKANYSFHVMRDHPWHGVPMLGGMWGVRMDLERELIANVSKSVTDTVRKRGPVRYDQGLLAKHVWSLIKGHVMQHDSYFCSNKKFIEHGGMTPFPTQRLNTTDNYVGSIVTKEDILTAKCPTQCRPMDHQDWERC